jgi:excinuclease ABC subunit B
MPTSGQFKLHAPFPPKGDQPQAIEKLVQGARDGLAHQVLLGATGTGKTYTACNVIAQLQRPTLVIAHNKTLAAQLCQEIREFFPENAVEYFVSYYDYYQPEAYVPHTDTYIEKESSRNDEIDRLRHSSTQSVTSRRDVVVVASVSCIYGLGTPELYQKYVLDLRVGMTIDRRATLEKLVTMQFARNDVNLVRGTFRVRGDVLEIHPRDAEHITRVDTFGDEIESIQIVNNLTGEVIEDRKYTVVFPATHFIADEDRMEGALKQIEHDLEEQVQYFHTQGKLLEAQRLQQRVRYDLEMMREVGYCNGIENYSRYLDGRQPGAPPFTLLNYFPKDYLLIVDESHQTLPQIRAMYTGDRARKETLIDFGFRLPAAFDNRPLRFEEFEERVGQSIYTSATPGPFEMEHIGYALTPASGTPSPAKRERGSGGEGAVWQPTANLTGQLVQQIIRPTGLVDPEIVIRPTRGQIDDLLGEIRARVAKNQRVLVTTLTKRMAEDLTEYLKELNVKVNYLHSDVVTMERSATLRELRQGKYDVVVGINLLREGLDLPEVSLVAILDADKEGFLRSETSLIQTIGRAARHVEGQVVMYADRITGSMQRAIDETNRRRALQMEYNERNGITPQTIQKSIRDDLISELLADARAELQPAAVGKKPKPEELPGILSELESEMKAAAAALDFERAAQLRDELLRLRELV